MEHAALSKVHDVHASVGMHVQSTCLLISLMGLTGDMEAEGGTCH